MKRLALMLLVGCAGTAQPPIEKPCPSVEAKSAVTPSFEYVGGTAIKAKDVKTLSAWYNDKFGLAIKGEMGGMAFGGFDWNGTSFNVAFVSAEGEHPGAAPGTAYLVFHVGDYDAFLAARAAQGLTPVSTTSDESGRFANFKDPEGNEVGIWGK
jgi:predicted enzyme related to lactoylglutathione lyase